MTSILTSSSITRIYSPHKTIIVVDGVIYAFYNPSTDYYIHYQYSTDGGATWQDGGALISIGGVLPDGVDVATDGTYIFVHVGTAKSYGYGRLYAYSIDQTTKSLGLITSTRTVEVAGSGACPSAYLKVDADGRIWCAVNHYTSWPEYHNYVGVEVFTFDGASFTSLGKYYEEISSMDTRTNPVRIADLGGGKALFAYYDESIDDQLKYWVLETDGVTLTKITSGIIYPGTISYGYRYAVAGDGAGKAIVFARRAARYVEASEYDAASDTWGPWFTLTDPSSSLYWSMTADWDGAEGAYYSFGVGDLARDTLGKFSVPSGSLASTMDIIWQSLEGTMDYYFSYSVFLDTAGGFVHVLHYDTDDNLRWEKFQYKTVSAGPTTISLSDVVGPVSVLQGQPTVGVKDNAGTIDVKAGTTGQDLTDGAAVTEAVTLARHLAQTLLDNITASDWQNMPALARLIAALSPIELSSSSGNTLAREAVGVEGRAVSSGNIRLSDYVSLSDVVTALQQILLQVEALAEGVGLTDTVSSGAGVGVVDEVSVAATAKAGVINALAELIAAVADLQVRVRVATEEVLTAAEGLTATPVQNVTTQALLDAVGMIEAVVESAVGAVVSEATLRAAVAGSASDVEVEKVSVVSRQTLTLGLQVVGVLSAQDRMVGAPQAVLTDVLSALDRVTELYINAIMALNDYIITVAAPRGSAGVQVEDSVITTEDVATLKWIFIREALRFYSIITTALTGESTVAVLRRYKSIITQLKYLQGR